MSTIVFSTTIFRLQIPQYQSETDYPDDTLELFSDQAECFLDQNNFGILSDSCQLQALNYVVAHLITFSDGILSNDTNHVVTSALISDTNVTIASPPFLDQWEYFLDTTGYGKLFIALMGAYSNSIPYIGGSNELQAFRKVSGQFF